MAIFEKEERPEREYIALMDKLGENILGFINPAKGVKIPVLVNKLLDLGLKVEIKQSNNNEMLDFELV